MIFESMKKESEAKIVLLQLQNTLNIVNQNTTQLNEAIGKSYENLHAVDDMSNEILVTVDEVARGNSEESTSDIFKNISQESENIAAISEEHSAFSEEMTASITQQDEKIKEVFQLIENIRNASKELEDAAKADILIISRND